MTAPRVTSDTTEGARGFQIGDRVTVDGVTGTLTARLGSGWVLTTDKPQRIAARVFERQFVIDTSRMSHVEDSTP